MKLQCFECKAKVKNFSFSSLCVCVPEECYCILKLFGVKLGCNMDACHGMLELSVRANTCITSPIFRHRILQQMVMNVQS